MILIVEDDVKISRLLELELKHEGYAVELVSDGLDALNLAINNDYDLIILDLMLPRMNGTEILKKLREVKNTPVIILTARDKVMDKVDGLDTGANDYMTKPFAIEELLARIRVHLKNNSAQNNRLTLGALSIDKNSRTVTYDGNVVDLTKKEYELLVYLVENKNIVVSREQIVEAVWGYDFFGNTNVVDVYVRYLRAKLDDIYGIKLVQTVRGAGYIIKS